jgi:alpha-2-macroglobulin
VPGLLDQLDQYPYGCTEQTTSTALPLLYFADVAEIYGKSAKSADMAQRVDNAILKLLERQTDNGGLGMWSSSDEVDPWASAYAFDFLSRAKALGHYVPPLAYDNLRRFLAAHISAKGDDTSGTGRTAHYYHEDGKAYALYVLSRGGFIGASDVRYFAQNDAGKLTTRMGKAQLAGALAAVGETNWSNRMFADAARTRRPVVNWWDYGSDERDAAASLVIMAESKKDPAAVLQIAETLERSVNKHKRYWSTQEAAWLLIAAHAVAQVSGGDVNINAGPVNYTAKKPYRLTLDKDLLAKGYTVKNNAAGPVRFIHSVRGAPVAMQPATANGMTINRHIFTMDGAPIGAGPLKQNTRVVVVIDGVKVDGAIGETLVTDLLPAGLEIESIMGGDAASGSDESVGSGMTWLRGLSGMRFSDARDDRFVAALDLAYASGVAYKVAYIARAITPGNYVHPGVYIEDMYQPQFLARGPAGRMSVVK